MWKQLTSTGNDIKLFVALNDGLGLLFTIGNKFNQAALHILSWFRAENLKVSVKLPDVVNASGISPLFPWLFALINNCHGKTWSSERNLAFVSLILEAFVYTQVESFFVFFSSMQFFKEHQDSIMTFTNSK